MELKALHKRVIGLDVPLPVTRQGMVDTFA